MVLAFTAAGTLHILWLKSSLSKRFAVPLDCGRSFRGKPVFGANKTWRGFMVMVPACGISFLVLAALLAPSELHGQNSWRLWQLSLAGYAALGLAAGFGYMAGELPNSFIKRQLQIAPGELPDGRWSRRFCTVADRLDSPLGGVILMRLIVPLPWRTWLIMLLVGPVVHSLFSALLYLLGIKKRVG